MKKLLLLSLTLVMALGLNAQMANEVISQIGFRNMGPGFMTGRISDIAKDPTDPSTWYVAVASGNVWKTENNGTTWQPIFEHYGSFSTGCITVDPKNPQTIWLGTGENQSQRSASWGDGVYKSTDGGQHWQHMGLTQSEHIGKILIDPRDSDTVYVASQGPLWKAGGDRGLYKTTDGGKTWNAVLQVSEHTGITDVVQDPNNPDVLYAASYQRRRHVGILIAGGPEARIYKSTDAGATWNTLSNGLPGGDLGRIALAISPQRSEVVYALISGKDPQSGGFYRSENAGGSWVKKNDYSVVDPQYYGEIFCDPHRFDHVYAMDVMVHYTTNGGDSFERLNSRYRHGDNHEMEFDPQDPNYMMIGGDGGIYESWDRGGTWKYHSNLPIMQFYRVGIDNAKPFYNVYGGTQDNCTHYAAVRNITRHGITNADWKMVIGGDGFQARVDPDDPNIVYGQYQYAGIVRFDKRTGQRIDIQPQPAATDDALRWHWDSPLVLSPHNSKRLYYAAQRIFKSDDRGDSWQPISGDLSRNENRNERKVMGKLWPPEAVYKNVFTSPYGTIVALSESPIQEGLIVAGTDDGLIQITENDGAQWRQVDQIKGVPQKAYVADVFTSNHDPKTIYAVFNNHKEGDYKPYFVKSIDGGKSWRSINSGIQPGHTGWSIVEDHSDPDLLFAATEFGLYASVNGGAQWTQMRGGLPTIAFRDLEIHKGEHDLIAASFGRGMYVLDDYSALRELDNPKADRIFPIKNTWQFFEKGDIGYGRKGNMGDDFYSADNPEYGAKIRVYVQSSIASLSQKRKADSSRYPSAEELKAEDFEQGPKRFVSISDAQGVTRALIPVSGQGFQEVVWDLHTQIRSSDGEYKRELSFVAPGTYTAQLVSLYAGHYQKLGNSQSFQVNDLEISEEKPAPNRFGFYTQVAQSSMQAEALGDTIDDLLKTLKSKKEAFLAAGKATQLAGLDHSRKQLLELRYQLYGNETKRKRFQYYLPGIYNRLDRVLDNQWESTQITQTQRDNFSLAQKQLTELEKAVAGVKTDF
ncbi:WD40/YVTN/BNR-like repeat-containing protein [Sediminicola luteus]|uniref:Sortilin N-terminal domain-containing protein n=1 Tax=Sediminicola luteus TaxID=319238 RepID=A0A2A4GDF2_9FLAO|nr:glycosyl hydrolase [Sediminicola luteus]PCE66483.1 hypothetical protein B7P33_04085 [Sediminicola luteus]